MPRTVTLPKPCDIVAEDKGHVLAVRLLRDNPPRAMLYRDVKVITRDKLEGRRAWVLSWMIHEQRFARGRDCGVLARLAPDILEWARAACAAEFTPEYAQEIHDLSSAEYDALAAGEISERKGRKLAALL